MPTPRLLLSGTTDLALMSTNLTKSKCIKYFLYKGNLGGYFKKVKVECRGHFTFIYFFYNNAEIIGYIATYPGNERVNPYAAGG